MSEIADVVIIGGGVVGTAIAAKISQQFENVFLLEALPRLGLGASTRNSGVIHAGIYYRVGSLKAFHCVRGSQWLYEFCANQRVPHQRIGKLIVAESLTDLTEIEALKKNGEQNGVAGLEIVDSAFIKNLEPNVVSPLALYSPNTGIIEAEELLKALARIATKQGAHLLTDTRVIGIEPQKQNLFSIRTSHNETVSARAVINAAGLYSDEVARMVGENDYEIYPCRGEYAELPHRLSKLVNRLIYPMPPSNLHGLGVHFTKNISGDIFLGPNAKYVADKDDYENNRAPLESFYESARKIAPELKFEDLRLSYSGLRARLRPEHDHRFADFVIKFDDRYPSMIQLIGIESPGLTSCLSIAESVDEMVREVFN